MKGKLEEGGLVSVLKARKNMGIPTGRRLKVVSVNPVKRDYR